MSQQINLILPKFKPHFDWLALPVVGGAAAAGLLFVAVMTGFGALRANEMTQRDAEVKRQMQDLQAQLLATGQALEARKGDPDLPGRLESGRKAVAQRQEVLAAVDGVAGGSGGFSGLMQAFAQRTLNGVWLTGFSFAGQDVEIRGRLTDASLLPAYIDKLNSEPAFNGRHFSALDMKAVDPAKQVAGNAGDTAAAKETKRPEAPFTEFALRTERVVVKEAER
jgi:Tfp pilus assembly protein PilN